MYFGYSIDEMQPVVLNNGTFDFQKIKPLHILAISVRKVSNENILSQDNIVEPCSSIWKLLMGLWWRKSRRLFSRKKEFQYETIHPKMYFFSIPTYKNSAAKNQRQVLMVQLFNKTKKIST